jgi:hypothetical protein
VGRITAGTVPVHCCRLARRLVGELKAEGGAEVSGREDLPRVAIIIII